MHERGARWTTPNFDLLVSPKGHPDHWFGTANDCRREGTSDIGGENEVPFFLVRTSKPQPSLRFLDGWAAPAVSPTEKKTFMNFREKERLR